MTKNIIHLSIACYSFLLSGIDLPFYTLVNRHIRIYYLRDRKEYLSKVINLDSADSPRAEAYRINGKIYNPFGIT